MTMSPFMQANKIKKPLLLIHGEADNNTGTFPMQVRRLLSNILGFRKFATRFQWNFVWSCLGRLW